MTASLARVRIPFCARDERFVDVERFAAELPEFELPDVLPDV